MNDILSSQTVKPSDKKHSLLRKMVGFLLTGLAAIIPVMGTIWLLVVIYQVLLRLGDVVIVSLFKMINGVRWELMGHSHSFLEWHFDFFGANLVRFLIPVVLLLLMGFTLASGPGHRLWHWVEHSIQRLPYLGYIYSALKQVVDAIKDLGGERQFKSVAYVEYPSPGCRLLGFVTGSYYDPQRKCGVTTVFLPTSPSPLTGMLVIMDDDKVHKSEMSMEEATKLIVSAGLVVPASFLQSKEENKEIKS